MIDPRLQKLIAQEEMRQTEVINLIASENYVSPEIRWCLSSVLTNKYAEGYPGRRYYGGCEVVDNVERLAIREACQLFGAEHANVQPHSGSQANQAVYLAFLQKNDPVLALSLAEGGHITHGLSINYSGQFYQFHHYGLDAQQRINPEMVEELAAKVRPKMIIVGATCYAKQIEFEPFRKIADKYNAILMVDMAHISGLVAAKQHPDPVPWADVVTSTTHKTLRGPRGGLILCQAKWASKIDKAVMPGLQGGPLLHVIAAKAQCFIEAQTPRFHRYIQNVIANSKTLSESLIKNGWTLVGGISENHLLSMDLSTHLFSGQKAEIYLGEAGIIVNKNLIPNDPKPPQETSGIRLGTAAITTLGFRPEHMPTIANWITQILYHPEKAPIIRKEVQQFLRSFPFEI